MRFGPRGDFHHFVLGPLRSRARLAKRAARHHGDPVADSEKLGKIRADDQDRLALRGQLADQAVDFGLGADIDAARRLVQEQNVGLLVESRASATFCWLPPERPATLCPGPVALTFSRSIQRATSARRSCSRSQP